MAAEHDFEIDQGSYWSQQVVWYDEGGTNPIDLTGMSARLQIRRSVESTEVLLELTSDPGEGITLGGVAGTILIEMTATQTAALPATRQSRRYYYDLEMVPLDGKVRRLIQGRAIVSPEVTR